MPTDDIAIKKSVRDRYARAAQEGSSCCAPRTSCGCGSSQDASETASLKMGYSAAELDSLPRTPTWAWAAAIRPPSPDSARAKPSSTSVRARASIASWPPGASEPKAG